MKQKDEEKKVQEILEKVNIDQDSEIHRFNLSIFWKSMLISFLFFLGLFMIALAISLFS